ncbi:MAG: hypothetical protein ACI4E1_00100 [Lachnospira sp.]
MKKISGSKKKIYAIMMTVLILMNSFIVCVHADEPEQRDLNPPKAVKQETGTLVVESNGLFIDYGNGAEYMSAEEGGVVPYTEQTDKWELRYGQLILKDGFEFNTTADCALRFGSSTNNYLDIQGDATIRYGCRDKAGIGIDCSGKNLYVSGYGSLEISAIQDSTEPMKYTAGIMCKNLTVDLEKDGKINAYGGDMDIADCLSAGLICRGDITVKRGTLNAVGGSSADGIDNLSIGLYSSGKISVIEGTINSYTRQVISGYGACLKQSDGIKDNTQFVGAQNCEDDPGECLFKLYYDDLLGDVMTFTAEESSEPLKFVRFTHKISNQVLVFKDGQLYCADYDDCSTLDTAQVYSEQTDLWSIDSDGKLVLEDDFYFKTTAPVGLYIHERSDGEATEILLNQRGGNMKLEYGAADKTVNVCAGNMVGILATGNLSIEGFGNLIIQGPEIDAISDEADRFSFGIWCFKTLSVDVYLGEVDVNAGLISCDFSNTSVGIYAEEGLSLTEGYINVQGGLYGIVTKDINYQPGEYSPGVLDAHGNVEALLMLEGGTITGDDVTVYGSSLFDNYEELVMLKYNSSGELVTSSDELAAKTVRILPELGKMTLFIEGAGEPLRIGLFATDDIRCTIPYTEQTDLWHVRGNELQLDGGFTFETSARVSVYVMDSVVIRINSSDDGSPVRITNVDDDYAYGICTGTDVTFTGDGHLIITGAEDENYLISGIESNGDVTVDLDKLGRIDIITGSEYGTGLGVYNGNLNMLFGTVNIKSNYIGMYAGNVNYSDGSIYVAGNSTAAMLKQPFDETMKVSGGISFDDYSDLQEVTAVGVESYTGDVYYKYFIGEEKVKTILIESPYVREKEDRSLYFDSKGQELLLKNSAGKSIPYDEQTDKWVIDENGTLILKDGFKFTTTADNAFIINGRDAKVKVEGTVDIEQCSESMGSDYVQAVVRIYKSATFTGDGTLNLIKTETADTYSSYAISCENELNIDLEPSGKINAVVKDKREGSGHSIAVATGKLILNGGILNAEAGRAGSDCISVGVIANYAESGLVINDGKLNATGKDYAVGFREAPVFSDKVSMNGNADYNTFAQLKPVEAGNETGLTWNNMSFYVFVSADGTPVKSVQIAGPDTGSELDSDNGQSIESPATGDSSGFFIWILALTADLCLAMYICMNIKRDTLKNN